MSCDIRQIGTITMIHGDALDVLQDHVGVGDLVVTDPPYRLCSGGSGKGGGKMMGGIFDAEDYDNSGDLMVMAEWQYMGPPIYRALKPDADAYFMTNDKNILLAGNAFVGAGFKFHNMLGWNKGAVTPNRWYMKHIEFVLYMWKGKARAIHDKGSKQMYDAPRPKLGLHPTEKPVDLMAYYIRNSSNQGDLVLDPFMGSGSTMLAAAQNGRRGLGIEIDRTHFETACARLERDIQERGGVA